MSAKRGVYIIRFDTSTLDLAALTKKQYTKLVSIQKELLAIKEFEDPILASAAALLILIEDESELSSYCPGKGLLN